MKNERKWLIDLRGSKTQEEVATAVGIHRAHYSHIENGTRTPSVELAQKIGSELKFDWTLFFNDKSVETTNATKPA